MRLSLLLVALLFFTACTSPKKEITMEKSKKTLFKTCEREALNVGVKELKNKIKLTWELENEKDVKTVIIEKKYPSGLVEKEKINPKIKEYTFKSKAKEKVKIKIKLYMKDGTISKGVKVEAEAKMSLIIRDETDYIDLSSKMVKLLFKVTEKSNVKLYFGDSEDNLKVIEEVENYNLNKKFRVGDLEIGKKYFYKVEAVKENEKIETKVLSFVKQEIKEDFAKAKWAENAVFYEIFVRSFCDGNGDGIGDFQGVAEKMPYLKELGVDALWLMPTFDSPSYHGYDVVDYLKTEPDYGTMEDFENMIKVAHEHGIKIILDFIINHSSVENPWFQDAISNPNSIYSRYYVLGDEFDKFDELGPWGQNIWYGDERGDYLAIFWSGMPDLNFGDKNLREEIKGAAKFWIDKGIDGFRLDASQHIDDNDMELTHAWWKDFYDLVKSENTDLFIVGENWNENPEFIAPFFKEMDSSFNFGISYQIIEAVKNGGTVNLVESLNRIRKIYAKYEKEFIDSSFLRNHDMPRVASELDEIGQQRLAAAVLFTLPGTPFMYYGEEIGQKGQKPDENIREPFDWYKSMEGKGMTTMSNKNPFRFTIKNDGISLEEQENDPESLYNYYKKLIKIRKDNKFMFNGEYKSIKFGNKIQAYDIFDPNNKDKKIRVIHNFSNRENSFENEENEYKEGLSLINGEKIGNSKIKLAEYETVIIEYNK